jgi:hypothetical protein
MEEIITIIFRAVTHDSIFVAAQPANTAVTTSRHLLREALLFM